MATKIISKACTKCKAVKPLSDFNKKRSRKDGRRSRCRSCERKDKEMYRKTPNGQAMIKQYSQSEQNKACRKRFSQTAKGKACRQRYKKKFPQKRKAGTAVGHAIRDGWLVSPKKLQCSCGHVAQEYHHHLGYEPENWLNVIPKCVPCHKALHRK